MSKESEIETMKDMLGVEYRNLERLQEQMEMLEKGAHNIINNIVDLEAKLQAAEGISEDTISNS